MPDSALTIRDILDIRHPESVRWDGPGEHVWFVYVVDGRPELWMAGVGAEPSRMSRPDDRVAAYDLEDEGAVYAAGGDVVEVSYDRNPRVLWHGQAPVTAVARSIGGRIALVCDGQLAVLNPKSPDGCLVSHLPMPHKIVSSAQWSPDGEQILVTVMRRGGDRQLHILDGTTGDCLFESDWADVPGQVGWLDAGTVAAQRLARTATRRQLVLIHVADGGEEPIYEEAGDHGLVVLGEMAVSPRGDAVAFVAGVDGWPHLIVWDRKDRERTVVLPGPHEDHGDEHEQPTFSADGRWLAFASSHGGSLQDRHVHLFDRADRTCRQITRTPGTHVHPAISPDGRRIAYLRATARQSLDVYLQPLDGGEATRVTHSMPEIWSRATLVEPEPLELTSRDGFRFHADLYRPNTANVNPGPALVFIHGGPMRQMRAGFHPMHAYAVFHAWNQYLVQQGYVILSVDYRGGTGYGTAYEQANFQALGQGDLDDVVAGAEYLKSLPEVSADHVGVWGLSYGGYLTLAALTKFPEVFRMGVNIAGIWDFEPLAHPGPEASGTVRFWQRRLGGPRSSANAVHYQQASPAHFADGLKAPLLNLHGTADRSVDFSQLDAIVRDLTRLHKRFQVVYYPDESHFFHRRETWEDAFGRMERMFAHHLHTGARDDEDA